MHRPSVELLVLLTHSLDHCYLLIELIRPIFNDPKLLSLNFFPIWNHVYKHRLCFSCQKHFIHRFHFATCSPQLFFLSILLLCLEFVIYPIAIGERMAYIRARVTWQMKTATLSPRMFGDCKLPEQAIRALEIWKSPTSYLWPLVWVDFSMPIF